MSLNVKVALVPGRMKDYVLEDGSTVRTALEIAEIYDVEGKVFKMNGRDVSLDSVVENGATIIVSGKITGNV